MQKLAHMNDQRRQQVIKKPVFRFKITLMMQEESKETQWSVVDSCVWL